MKVAITGGSGFIGSVLAEELLRAGHKVRIVDLSRGFVSNKKIEYKRADICAQDRLKNSFKDVDCVVHLAAYSKIRNCIKNPELAFRINVGGTLNVLLSAKACGVRRVIYASSSSVYGNQASFPFREDMPVRLLNPYASTKFGGEQICREFPKWCSIEVVALRLFNVYGSDDAILGNVDCPSVVEIFMKQKKLGQKLTVIGDGGQKRDLVHVSDVAAAFKAAIESKLVGRGEIINVGSGVSHSVAEIARLISGGAIEIGNRYEEAYETLADISRAKKLLKWKPKQDLKKWIVSQIR